MDEATFDAMDAEFMTKALSLSDQSVAAGNHPFGALLVVDGEIMLEAENTVNSEKDVTCHAELNLVRQASRHLTLAQRTRAILYTSTEPCAMCAGAIYWAQIPVLVYGCPGGRLNDIAGASLSCHCRDVYQGAVRPPLVRGPVLEEAAAAQHTAYWTSHWNEA